MMPSKHRNLLAVPILVAAAVVPVAAQSPDRQNAATWYQRAIEAYQAIPREDVDRVLDYMADAQGPPPADVLTTLRRAGPALDYFRRGSEQPYHDLHLDYSQGFELILPHLAPMRGIARLSKADALISVQRGDAHTAADRIASVYRMSSHLASDRVLISTLVGQAIFTAGDDVLQEALDRAMIGPAEGAMLLRAAQQVRTDDPFGYLESLMMEQTIAVEYMEKKFGDQAGRVNAHEILEWLAEDDDTADVLAGMSDEQFHSELAQYDAAMNQVVEVFMIGDRDEARAQLDALTESIIAGEHGLLASIMMPAFSRVFDRRMEALDLLDARIETLSGLVTGEIKPEEQANAALYYLRGIEMMREKLTIDDIQALRACALGPRGAVTVELRSKLEETDGIIDVFREGSLKRRCDFDLYRRRGEAALLPAYAAGLHIAGQLLRVDARRLLEDDRLDDAVDRLAIAFRMSAHVSEDEPLVMPLVAHTAFSAAVPLMRAAADRDEFTTVHQWQLFDAVDAIPLRDPFGYIGSVVSGKKTIANEIMNRSPAFRGRDVSPVNEAAEHWNGDQLVLLAVVFDTMKRTADVDDAAPAEELAAMDDIIDAEALEAARDDVPVFAPMIAQGQLNFFEGDPIPRVVEYIRCQQRARADLRAALAVLRPERDADHE